MPDADFDLCNIAHRMSDFARKLSDAPAVIAPMRNWRGRTIGERQITFRELDEQSDRIAAGLIHAGAHPGMKLVLFVPFSIEFVTLTFALFKTGVTVVLIDPGMGRTNIFKCLDEVQPDGFVAIPVVHVLKSFAGKSVKKAGFNISVGPWLPGIKKTYRALLQTTANDFQPAQTRRTDRAAIIFTSGSTGAPKGVLYEHGMFDGQVDLIRRQYAIQPCEVDLSGFPLFGLFNAAMGVTTVVPDMDPTRPAQVDPHKIIAAIERHQVTQAFGSPAFWNRVGRYCEQHSLQLPTIKRALSAGGPVPVHVLQRMSKILTRDSADLFTPYGATESLPVSSISASQVLKETATKTSQGSGTCVGELFPQMRVKIIRVTDGPISHLKDVEELAAGEIGEIIVSGPTVTREYYQQEQSTRQAKIPDDDGFWHRIGDVGYLDEQNRLWFCGRKAHIIKSPTGPMYSVCCEAIFNVHPQIYRCALVGVPTKDSQLETFRTPVIVAEPEQGEFPNSQQAQHELIQQLQVLAQNHPLTASIQTILLHPSLPVDTRHNVKINREALGHWATEQLKS